MLAFTLSPASDETLYSIVARHGTLLGRHDAGDLTAAISGSPAEPGRTTARPHCPRDGLPGAVSPEPSGDVPGRGRTPRRPVTPGLEVRPAGR